MSNINALTQASVHLSRTDANSYPANVSDNHDSTDFNSVDSNSIDSNSADFKDNPPVKSDGQSQQQIRRHNEQIILAAAEAEFVRKGFQGATMQEIADRAGLPKANVHYYFKSKKNLYQCVLTNIIQEWNEGFEEITEDSDPKTTLERFIKLKLTQAFAHPNRHKLFALEVINGAPNLQEFMQTTMKEWANDKIAIINTWHQQGKIDVQDPLHLLILIWASTQRYAEFEAEILGLLGQDKYSKKDQEKAAAFLVPFILKGCGLQ